MKLPRNRNIKVNSSMINQIFYTSTFTKEWLFVEFKNGALYEYKEVPFKVFKNLKNANKNSESVGKLFNDTVKSVGYAYKKIDSI